MSELRPDQHRPRRTGSVAHRRLERAADLTRVAGMVGAFGVGLFVLVAVAFGSSDIAGQNDGISGTQAVGILAAMWLAFGLGAGGFVLARNLARRPIAGAAIISFIAGSLWIPAILMWRDPVPLFWLAVGTVPLATAAVLAWRGALDWTKSPDPTAPSPALTGKRNRPLRAQRSED